MTGPGPTLGFLSGTLSHTTEKAPKMSGPLGSSWDPWGHVLLFYIRRNFLGPRGLAEVAEPGRRRAGPEVIQVLCCSPSLATSAISLRGSASGDFSVTDPRSASQEGTPQHYTQIQFPAHLSLHPTHRDTQICLTAHHPAGSPVQALSGVAVSAIFVPLLLCHPRFA